MLFGNKDVLDVNDFCSNYFSEGWDCSYRKCGRSYYGCKLIYPVECKLYINWSGKNRYFKGENGEFVSKGRSFSEMMKVVLYKVNCS